MKKITALLIATLGMHTDNYLVMSICLIAVVYLIVKE
jgi:hypothetical protein